MSRPRVFALTLLAMTAFAGNSYWNAGRELFFSRGSNGLPLGAFELARVRKDHDMVRTLYGLERPFDPKDAFSDEFLDAVVEPPR